MKTEHKDISCPVEILKLVANLDDKTGYEIGHLEMLVNKTYKALEGLSYETTVKKTRDLKLLLDKFRTEMSYMEQRDLCVQAVQIYIQT